MKQLRLLCCFSLISLALLFIGHAERASGKAAPAPTPRAAAAKLMQAGNWQEAYNAYAKFIDAADDPARVSDDFE